MPRGGGPRRGGAKKSPPTRYPTTPVVAGIVVTSALAPNFDVAETYTLTGSIISGDIPLPSEPGSIGTTGLSDRTVTFTSSDTGHATVTASTTTAFDGSFSATVTGQGAGGATITIECEGVRDSSVVCTVTSPQNAVASVEVSPTGATGTEGDTLEFAATVKDSGGNTLPGKTVTWSETTGPSLITTGADSGDESHTVSVVLNTAGSAGITATSDAVNSTEVGITINAAASGTLYFADKMDGGTKHAANGWSWSSSAATVQANPGGLPGGLDASTSYALRHIYLTTSPANNTEQRFNMGQNLAECFVGFYIYYPSNYFHRNGPSSDNNKFFRMWSGNTGDGNGGYSQYSVKGGFSTQPTPSSGGGSYILPEYGYANSSCAQAGVGAYGHFFTFSEAIADGVGAWYKVQLRLALASAVGNSDGALQMWINDALWGSQTNLDWYTRCVGGGGESTMYFNKGYFLGAANSGFNEQTTCYIARVRFASTLALSDPDLTTGWTS